MDYYDVLKKEMARMAVHMGEEKIHIVSARPLSPEEAIGKPDRADYPILKGKEVMMEAVFRDARGQAFTDMPGSFEGTLQDILGLGLQDNFERAMFIAGFNAVMRHFCRASNTVHCRDGEPKACAKELPAFVEKHFGKPKIAFVGYQPAMIEALSVFFTIRVVDLDRDNIGANRFGIVVEGPDKTDEVLTWSNIILATGSTYVNGTMVDFLDKKPVVFYGISAAGPTAFHGYMRYCPYSA
jgi:hypothetical protein